ncbi:MAG: hypothetical protein KDK26_04460 [Roseivivax sp.]|nr:hypothetical protein [Roseivivax sp.]
MSFSPRATALAVLVLAGLTGCVAITPEEGPFAGGPELVDDTIKLTAKGQAMPVVAAVQTRVRGGTMGPGGFVPDRNAVCELKAETFTVLTHAPTYLRLPSYGPQTPPVAVLCTLGARRGERTVAASLLRPASDGGGSAARGFIGPGAVAVVIAPQQRTEVDIWGYPDIDVVIQ